MPHTTNATGAPPPSKLKPSTAAGGLLIGMILLIAVSLCSRQPSGDNSSTGALAPCTSGNAQCLGNREIEQARAPCKQAIETSLGTASRWTYSTLEEPFNQATWYTPNSTIIYTGNQLEAGSAGYRRSYYCVWNPATHSLVKAAVND